MSAAMCSRSRPDAIPMYSLTHGAVSDAAWGCALKRVIVNLLMWLSERSWQSHARAELIATRLRRYRWFREG